MSDYSDALAWLTRTLSVGGGLLLLASAAFAFVRQPVRRRAIAWWGVRAALLAPLLTLAPSWLHISLPETPVAAPATVAVAPAPAAPPVSPAVNQQKRPIASVAPANMAPLAASECYVFFAPIPSAPAVEITRPVQPPKPVDATAPPPVVDSTVQVSPAIFLGRLLFAIYATVAAFFVGRWLIGHIALWRLLRSSRPAGKSLTRLFNDLACGWRVPPELRTCRKLRSPVCFGLWRQVVLLPQQLAESGDEQSLRLVFAHELAHLERGDSWNGCWFGLAQALYFPMPWFWWLKRQVRLCQEYVADAAATKMCGATDYAAFLVNLSRSTRPTRHSAVAAGVIGNSSDLFRRVNMLLNSKRRVDGVCPRRWSLLAAGAFLTLAVLLSGVGLSRAVMAADTPKDDEKKAADEVPLKPRKPAAKPGDEQPPRNQEELDKHIQKMMEEMQRRLTQQDAQLKKIFEEMQKQMQQGGFGGVGMLPPGGLGGGLFRPGANVFGGAFAGHGRLGAAIEKPSAALIEQLDLPKDQGIVLTEVRTDSAAAKAGLKTNDILLELNGKPVSSDPREFRKQISEIKANQAIDAVVLRKGKRETVKGLSLPESKAENDAFGGFGQGIFLGPDGVQVQGKLMPLPFPPRAAQEGLPAVPPIQFGGAGANKSLSVSVSNDRFTINSRDDGLNISLIGKMEDGKAVLESATITDGGKPITANSLEKVPEKHRSAVKALLDNIKVGK